VLLKKPVQLVFVGKISDQTAVTTGKAVLTQCGNAGSGDREKAVVE
jgi:hypothetical protein